MIKSLINSYKQIIRGLDIRKIILSVQPNLTSIIILLIFLFIVDVYGLSNQVLNYYSPYSHIYFLDVGQGDSTLIKTKNKSLILIDAGPDENIEYQLYKTIPFWVKQIDTVIISHTHEDHFNGLIYLSKNYEINNLYYRRTDLNQNFENILEVLNNKPKNLFVYNENKKEYYTLCNNNYFNYSYPNDYCNDTDINDCFYFIGYCLVNVTDLTTTDTSIHDLVYDNDDIIIDNEYVLKKFIKDKSNLNNFSVVSSIKLKQKSGCQHKDYCHSNLFNILLSMGDLEKNAQSNLNYLADKYLILKIPHQGSVDSLNINFINKVSPKYGIIFARKNNKYGHPHAKTLDAYTKRGIDIFCTCDYKFTAVTILDTNLVRVEYKK